MMIVIDPNERDVLVVLGNANIVGSDARTCWEQICIRHPGWSQSEIRAHLGTMDPMRALNEYGADAGRAAYVLSFEERRAQRAG